MRIQKDIGLDELEPELAYMITSTPKKFILLKEKVNELKQEAKKLLEKANKLTHEEIFKFREEIKQALNSHLSYI